MIWSKGIQFIKKNTRTRASSFLHYGQKLNRWPVEHVTAKHSDILPHLPFPSILKWGERPMNESNLLHTFFESALTQKKEREERDTSVRWNEKKERSESILHASYPLTLTYHFTQSKWLLLLTLSLSPLEFEPLTSRTWRPWMGLLAIRLVLGSRTAPKYRIPKVPFAPSLNPHKHEGLILIFYISKDKQELCYPHSWQRHLYLPAEQLSPSLPFGSRAPGSLLLHS